VTRVYAANQTTKLPGELAEGDFVYSESRWVPVDHVEVEDGMAVIHLAPIRCEINEPIQVCKAS